MKPRFEIAEEERLMTPAEVCAAFRVTPQTLHRWARAGRLSAVRTPGGTRRYRAAEVRALRAPETVREAGGRCEDCGYLTARCPCGNRRLP